MKQQVRILYLTHDGLTDPLGQSQILPYLTGLSSLGYQIAIISLEKRDNFFRRRSQVADLCKTHGIVWQPLPYHTRPPVLSSVFDLWRMRRRAAMLHRSKPFQIVHCRSYLTSLTGLWLKRKFGLRFLFDMRGFWADERRESGAWPVAHPLYSRVYQFFKQKEKEFLRTADAIVSLTQNAASALADIERNHAPVTVIPTCVDMNHFDPVKVSEESKDALRSRYGIAPGEPVMLYLGSWGNLYLPDKMLAFFDTLRVRAPYAKFIILSNNPSEIQLTKTNGLIIASASRDEVPTWISIATFGVCFISPTFSKKASAATKIAELLAMNVPFVTNAGWGDLELLARDTGCGWVLPDFSNASLVEATESLLAGNLSANFREVCQNHFDLNSGVRRYNVVYQFLSVPTKAV